jgi:hypothetical protein
MSNNHDIKDIDFQIKIKSVEKEIEKYLKETLDSFVGQSVSDVSLKVIESAVANTLKNFNIEDFQIDLNTGNINITVPNISPGVNIPSIGIVGSTTNWPSLYPYPSDPYASSITSYATVDARSAFLLSFLQCYPLTLDENNKPSLNSQKLICNLAILAFKDALIALPICLPVISKFFTDDGFEPGWFYQVNLTDITTLSAITVGAKLMHLVLNSEFNDDTVIENLALYKLKKPLVDYYVFEGDSVGKTETEEVTKELFNRFQNLNPFK